MREHADQSSKRNGMNTGRDGLGPRSGWTSAVSHRASGQAAPTAAEHIIQLQKSIGNAAVGQLLASASGPPVQKKENKTGMPDRLKQGIESLSGMDMSHVQVHYNSDKPASVGAEAYAQGSSIHIAPGQEKHLPHESWHVVQQMKGIVPATGTENGLPVNEDETLEREADEMGSRAISLPEAGPSEAPLAAASAPPGAEQAPIQFVRVKLQKSYSKTGSDKYVVARDNDKDGEDTSTMKLSQKREVLKDLQKEKKYAKEVQALTKEINMISSPITEEDIIGYGRKLDELLQKNTSGTAFNKKDEADVEELSFRLLSALDYLGSFDEGEAEAKKMKAMLQLQLEKMFKLDNKALKKARNIAEIDFEEVTPEEMAAYREDIKSGGVWGGGAEASVIAGGVGIHLQLLILDENNKYVRADTIGNPGGAASAFSLLNLGTHYVVVDAGIQAGQEFKDSHIEFNPEPDGDCMFNALHYALTDGNRDTALNWQSGGVGPIALTRDNFVRESRQIVSGNMSDDSVRLSVEEILLSGQSAGVGPNLKHFIHFRDNNKKNLLDLLNQYGIDHSVIVQALREKGLVPPSFKGNLPQMLDKYDEKKKDNPEGWDRFLQTILNIVYAKSVEMDKPIEGGPSEKFERELRKKESDKYRQLYEVHNSEHNAKQLIVSLGKDKEFVLDRIGQLVPRFVYRSISDYNIAELEHEGSIYPSGDSPVSKKDSPYDSELKKKYSKESSTTGSGIGDNKVPATPEMLHVEGAKPSRFLSTTKAEEGTVNPDGESFGSSLYRIDLSYIDPGHIADLSGTKGISYYMLGNYEKKSGSDPDRHELIDKARSFNTRQEQARDDKKKSSFNATTAAQEDRTLSAKEWQALMDVVRTSEVLVNTKIPAEALGKA